MKDSVGRSVAAVRQIQAQYNATEDRIMLRIGTKDAENVEVPGIWITRRYLSLLCKALQQFFNADIFEGQKRTEFKRTGCLDH